MHVSEMKYEASRPARGDRCDSCCSDTSRPLPSGLPPPLLALPLCDAVSLTLYRGTREADTTLQLPNSDRNMSTSYTGSPPHPHLCKIAEGSDGDSLLPKKTLSSSVMTLT